MHSQEGRRREEWRRKRISLALFFGLPFFPGVGIEIPNDFEFEMI